MPKKLLSINIEDLIHKIIIPSGIGYFSSSIILNVLTISIGIYKSEFNMYEFNSLCTNIGGLILIIILKRKN